MDKPSDGNELATRQQLAAALGVHAITISKWQNEGMPIASRGGRGRPTYYSVEAVTAWRAAREEEARDKTNGPLDPVQERAKKERFQALLAEQTFLLRAKKLLSADEVAKVWRAEVAAVRALILTSYTTHADRVHRAAVKSGLAGVEAELKKLGVEVLRELSDPDRPTGDQEPAPKKRARAKSKKKAAR